MTIDYLNFAAAPLGERITRGLGVSGDYILGQKTAEESRNEIKQAAAGEDIVFVTAGMGEPLLHP